GSRTRATSSSTSRGSGTKRSIASGPWWNRRRPRPPASAARDSGGAADRHRRRGDSFEVGPIPPEIATWRRPELAPERGHERTRALVADLRGHRGDRPAPGQQARGLHETQALPPPSEGHVRLAPEQPLQRALARAGTPGGLGERDPLDRGVAEQLDRPTRPRVARRWKLQWNLGQHLELVQDDARHPRMRRLVAPEQPRPCDMEDQLPQQRRDVHGLTVPG